MSKYWKTIVQIEILSEGENAPPVDEMGLNDISYMITDGDWSGQIDVTKQVEVTPVEMAKLLIAQGSDPEFLGLKEDGSPAQDEETDYIDGDGDSEE